MPPAPTSAFIELMGTTMTLALNLNCSPFEIFDKDVDDVITVINYYIEMGAIQGENQSTNTKQTQNTKSKETRIRVNDKTATGGWF